ncbi:MAG: PIN domain-containing protein [Spirochaetales bacterium]|nr:PIN domain-containing protein [Spirochaetales bacterium]
MNLLIDTNVLLDVFLQRKPFENHSKRIFKMCVTKKCSGIIAAHSYTNMFYILRKHFEQKDLRKLLLNLSEVFEISCIDKQKIVSSLQRTDFIDFEDCLQEECALEMNGDYIITRNTEDFKNSRIPAVTPEEFLKYKG